MKITYYISIVMIALAMFLGGCDERKDVERKDLSFLGMNQNEVFDPEEYPYLSAFMGNMTGNDLLTILDTGMKILNESQRLGYTSTADYQSMLGIMTHLRDTMSQEMTSESLDTTLVADISALLAIMAGEDPLYPDCRVGTTLDQLIQKVGPDVLGNEVKSMLTYLVATDTTTLKDAVSGLSITDIKDHPESFETLMTTVNGMLDPGPTGRYNALYEGLIDYGGTSGIIDQLGAVSGSEITLGDLKPVLDALQAIDFSSSGFLTAETETALDNAITALDKIIDGQASSLQQADIENIIGLLYRLVAWCNETEDGGATIDPDVMRETVNEVIDLLANDTNARQELAGMLYSVARLLSSDDLPLILNEVASALDESGLSADQTIATFLDEIISQMPSVPVSPATADNGRSLPEDLIGTATTGDLGILTRIALDYSHYEGVDEGLSDYFIQRDEFGVSRTSSGNESAFVSLLKAIQNSDINAQMSVVAAGLIPISMTALNIVHPQYYQSSSWHDCEKDATTNISEFLVGEMVRSIKYRYGVPGASISKGGAPAAADFNDDGGVDPNEALYWLLWEKRYHIEYSLLITFQKDYSGVLRFAFMRLQDLTNLISSPAASSYGLDLAPPVHSNASTVYPGRIRDYIPALAALSGWDYSVSYSNGHVTAVNPSSDSTQDPAQNSLAQPRHTLISLMWPLMDYFWENGETGRLIDLLTGILDSSTIDTVSGVLVADGASSAQVLKALEGVNGTGTIARALRSHGTNDDGLLDNALPLISRIIGQLDSTGLLRTNPQSLTTELNTLLADWVQADQHTGQDPDLLFIQQLEQTLFTDTDDAGHTAMVRTRMFLSQNQSALADLCTALGDIMTKGNGLDPLVSYTVSGAFFANLQTIWDNGNTWDKLQADMDDINLQFQTISGNTGFDFMAELEATLADLRDLDTTPADIGNRPVTALLRHLLTQSDGGWHYNPFVDSLLSLTCKTLDLYDENYNPGAVVSATGITADTTVVEAVQHLTGAYDLLPLQNLLVALTEKQTDEGDLLLYKLLADLSTFSDEAFGDGELPISIVQSLFREVDVRGTPTSAVAVVMDQIYPGMVLVHSGELSFQDVIGDANRLFGGLDMQPNGEVYTTLFQALDFVVQNVRVQQ